MNERVVVTDHGARRTKERVGLSKKLAEKNAEKALAFGLTHADTKAGLHKYLDKLYLSNGTANNMRIYHHYIYMFRGNTLITILPLPNNLCKLADKLQKEKGGGGSDNNNDG